MSSSELLADVNRRTLLIVWHSRTGAAQQMAHAVAQGAQAAALALEDTRLDVVMSPALETSAAAVLNAHGYGFCSPENLAGMTGEMKAFFDRNYYAVGDAVAGRPYAAFVAAGTDGTGAVRQMERIVTGWRLQAAAAPIIHRNGAQTPEAILAAKTVPEATLAQCREHGGTLAALLLI